MGDCDKEQKIPYLDLCSAQRMSTDDPCSNFRTSSNQNCQDGTYGFCQDGGYCWPNDLTISNAGWKYGLRLDPQARNIIRTQTDGYLSSCRDVEPGDICDNSWTDTQGESGIVSGIDIGKCESMFHAGSNRCYENGDNDGIVTFDPNEYHSCRKTDCPSGYIKDPAKIDTVCRTATGCTTDDCCMLHDCDKHGPPYGATEEVWAEWVHRCPTQAAQEMDRQCATGTYAGKIPWGATSANWAKWVRKCPKEAAGCGGRNLGPPWGASSKDWANWVRWCPKEVKDMYDAACEKDPQYCNHSMAPDPKRCTTSPDTWAMNGQCP